jgi:hypothetical protein
VAALLSPASDGAAETTLIVARCHCRGDLAMAQCCCRVMLETALLSHPGDGAVEVTLVMA